jgi:hypothetical protein
MSKPKYLEELSGDAIDQIPIDADWSEGYGETWESMEAVECDKCGKVLVVTGPGGDSQHKDLDYTSECDGYCGSADGPMMNYWYPLPGCSFDEDNAAKISHLPLALVQVNGETGIALTGGGMDLTWEIIAAHVALGYLPPLHFCRPPKMADRWTRSRAKLIRCCEETLRVAKRRLEYTAADLRSTVKYYREREQNKKSA